MREHRQALQGLLLRELRAAVAARNESGADPRQLTAYLEQRLRRIRQLQRDTPVHRSARVPNSGPDSGMSATHAE